MAEQSSNTLHQIWENTTKLSEEAIEAAKKRAEADLMDLNKGLVSFAETRINLIHSRDVIADAIDTSKLTQLPLSIQYELKALLDRIVANLTSMSSGGDEVVLFANNVEELNVLI